MINKDNLSFSQRMSLEPIEVPYQNDNMDKTLRTELWNAYYIFIQQPAEESSGREQAYKNFNQIIWIHFLKKALDDFPTYNSNSFGLTIRKYIETQPWNKVYEFFEFTFRNIEERGIYDYGGFGEFVNDVLRTNHSAFTLTNNLFIPIISKEEIEEIKKTQQLSKSYGLDGIQEHLNSAISLISKKPIPDFRNSIKESISMVEVISRIIEPTENTLGKALNKLEKKQKINSTLKAGFEKLYAYTNDKNGIRHALMDDQNTDVEDAKFFLVSCSAFTNYLIEKANKENLLIQK